MCSDVPQSSTIPRSGGGDIGVGGQAVPHMSQPTMNSVGGSTLPQWQNWRSLGISILIEFSTISPEPSKHETSFSTFFDALSQADVSIFKMEKIPRKKVRRERIVVASQNIASKVVRAFVVFHTHARGQSTISCPHLAVFAGFSS